MIQQIAFKNFRRFASLDILNLSDINILVGANNSGKTTVTKGIMLALDNLRSLQWTKIPFYEGLYGENDCPRPIFDFNVNECHNLHIGTFGRAKCNRLDDPCINIVLMYGTFEFDITIVGSDDSQVQTEIERLKVYEHESNCWFDFSFQKPFSMSFGMGKKGGNS